MTKLKLSHKDKGWIEIDIDIGNLFSNDDISDKLYDEALTGSTPNDITSADVAITVAVNSRANYKTLASVYGRREDINKALSTISKCQTLTDANDEIFGKVKDLFRIIMVSHVGLSTASKILHKKRPYLIPIIDTYILKHYKMFFSEKKLPEHEKAIVIMKEMKKEIEHSENQDFFKKATQKWQLSKVRLLEKAIWIQHDKLRTK